MPNTPQDNVKLVRRGFEAFNKGDVKALTDIIAADCVQHMPGKNRFSGDHKGRDNILAMYGEMGELTAGTMQAVLTDVYASDHGAVALFTTTATRDGKTIEEDHALVFQLVAGKAIDMDDIALEGKVNDAFWK
jgi:ketosteroid isomerase-like protein